MPASDPPPSRPHPAADPTRHPALHEQKLPGGASAAGVRVRVVDEHESEHGWTYQVLVRHAGGVEGEHTVTLSWRDHDHWSGGATPPSRVIEALIVYVLQHLPAGMEGLPRAFDASTARRWVPSLERELRETL